MRIVAGLLDDPRVIAMLKFHFDTNIGVTPPGSAHVFDVSRLKQSDIHFWSAWDGEILLGTAALKVMNAHDGEVKSMHSLVARRRSGIGSAMVEHVIAEARGLGLKRLYLETGSFDFFAPARALYSKHGFEECGPFEGYKLDPNSTFMTRII